MNYLCNIIQKKTSRLGQFLIVENRHLYVVLRTTAGVPKERF